VPWQKTINRLDTAESKYKKNFSKTINVGIIGDLGFYKGTGVIQQYFEVQRERALEFNIIHFGKPSKQLLEFSSYFCVGQYDDAEIKDLLRKNEIDIVWFPNQCPETYSFALTIAIESGLPISASNVGSFSERLHGLEFVKVSPKESSIESWVKDWILLLQLQNKVKHNDERFASLEFKDEWEKTYNKTQNLDFSI
jgi:glycosyltransferase involved in cell wall biosynthesis